MMSDSEFINFIDGLEKPSGISLEDWLRLIRIARIGAAVQPRPISEAPKDDLILAFSALGGGQWDVLFLDPTETSDYPWKTRDGQEGYHKDLPTHFIPLSALPQVKP